MKKVLIFGGTTEGRELGAFCEAAGIPADLTVATRYGKEVLPAWKQVRVLEGRLDEQEIEALVGSGGYAAVLDATHPYAAEVSRAVREACEKAGLKLWRVIRPAGTEETEEAREGSTAAERAAGADAVPAPVEAGPERYDFPDSMAAAAFLEKTEGRILLTTGSKELPDFAAISRERLYVRVLPSAEAVSLCRNAGIAPSHIAAMQGPFTTEMNAAMLRFFSCRYLVTKESGRAGGFAEKLAACRETGAAAVIIRRPVKESGITEREAEEILRNMQQAEQVRLVHKCGTCRKHGWC